LEVLGLHGDGLGFGVAFRLRVMASVAGSAEDVPNLLGLLGDEEGGRGLGWGAWHGLSGPLLAEPEGLPRKLGRIVSGSSRPGHAGGRPVVPLTAGGRERARPVPTPVR